MEHFSYRKLPRELWAWVASHLCAKDEASSQGRTPPLSPSDDQCTAAEETIVAIWEGQADLLRLAATCRHLRGPAEQALYRHIVIHSEDVLFLLLRTLLLVPAKRQLVLSVRYEIPIMPTNGFDTDFRFSWTRCFNTVSYRHNRASAFSPPPVPRLYNTTWVSFMVNNVRHARPLSSVDVCLLLFTGAVLSLLPALEALTLDSWRGTWRGNAQIDRSRWRNQMPDTIYRAPFATTPAVRVGPPGGIRPIRHPRATIKLDAVATRATGWEALRPLSRDESSTVQRGLDAVMGAVRVSHMTLFDQARLPHYVAAAYHIPPHPLPPPNLPKLRRLRFIQRGFEDNMLGNAFWHAVSSLLPCRDMPCLQTLELFGLAGPEAVSVPALLLKGDGWGGGSGSGGVRPRELRIRLQDRYGRRPDLDRRALVDRILFFGDGDGDNDDDTGTQENTMPMRAALRTLSLTAQHPILARYPIGHRGDGVGDCAMSLSGLRRLEHLEIDLHLLFGRRMLGLLSIVEESVLMGDALTEPGESNDVDNFNNNGTTTSSSAASFITTLLPPSLRTLCLRERWGDPDERVCKRDMDNSDVYTFALNRLLRCRQVIAEKVLDDLCAAVKRRDRRKRMRWLKEIRYHVPNLDREWPKPEDSDDGEEEFRRELEIGWADKLRRTWGPCFREAGVSFVVLGERQDGQHLQG